MNKKKLIDIVTEQVDITKGNVQKVVEAMFYEISKELAKDKKVRIVGFGTFEPRKKAAREGRDPITHKPIKIEASNYIGFKMGNTLRNKIKRNNEGTQDGQN
ncbi:MAG: hypothetical protein A2Y40_04100 [Candidatus Margulisbacteria bacterium GWF2_35_9]|nr:MAG: hypothetical protein A2Y40_04100 [Candidatus Margulisbacteria bacterium GWF2_35_9]